MSHQNKQSDPATLRTLVITFDEVKSGKTRLIAGYMETRVKLESSDGKKPYEFSKAVEYDISGKNEKSVFLQKIQAVSDFLNNAHIKDRITIYTDDAFLLDIRHEIQDDLFGQPLFKAGKRNISIFKNLSEKFKSFSVRPIASEDHQNVLENLQRTIGFRINQIQNPNNESKHYINRPQVAR
ncbi:MAG: hypothetical protein AAF182_00225 [Pseudomonadota bacterium]